ncbi:MAG: hypothetical protein PF638_15065 [Candidatus Delongbacteria bacterium]|jgi:hypothetical protein|nr:hypothetical protein [Candidatus Delongbacteria bacterium]
MSKKSLVLFWTIILGSILNAQSILHVGVGLGGGEGVFTEPYKDPFISLSLNADCEYEFFVLNTQSISLRGRYSDYNKSELFSTGYSEKYSYGISYNFTNVILTDKFFNEISPIIEYGVENVKWGDSFNISFWGDPDEPLTGEDKLSYLTFGSRFSIGLKQKEIVYKLSMLLFYDHILTSERNISNDPDNSLSLDPDFKTQIYGIFKFSIGYMF